MRKKLSATKLTQLAKPAVGASRVSVSEQQTLQGLNKVPEVTALFWVVKILSTGVGETSSDYLAHTIGPVIAVLIGGVLLVASLVWQFRSARYQPWRYWSAVLMVSVFGTMVADVLHVVLGIPYMISTIAFAIMLSLVFLCWYRSEGTLSIHTINSRRSESFYWATVLVTFALGTAVGDLTAATFGWGYFASGMVFLALIAIPAIGYARFGLNEVFAFWAAYVLTRPLGASFADWFAVSRERGGLDHGAGWISLILLAVIVFLVAYLARVEQRKAAVKQC